MKATKISENETVLLKAAHRFNCGNSNMDPPPGTTKSCVQLILIFKEENKYYLDKININKI